MAARGGPQAAEPAPIPAHPPIGSGPIDNGPGHIPGEDTTPIFAPPQTPSNGHPPTNDDLRALLVTLLFQGHYISQDDFNALSTGQFGTAGGSREDDVVKRVNTAADRWSADKSIDGSGVDIRNLNDSESVRSELMRVGQGLADMAAAQAHAGNPSPAAPASPTSPAAPSPGSAAAHDATRAQNQVDAAHAVSGSTTSAPSSSTTAAGSVSGTPSSSSTTSDLGGTPNPDGLFGIPGGAKIWEVDGKDWYAVYFVPGTNTPLAWKIDAADLPAVFGPGVTPHADEQLNGLQAFARGPLVFGSSRMLANTSEHPFDAFTANFQTEATIRPWLRDPEILALTTRALLENRTVTDAELAGTKWWQSHSAGERAWISQFNSDPATAQQKITDGRDTVRQTMIAAGIANVPDSLVNLIADRVTGGTWTSAYANSQITKLADPAAPGTLDTTLHTWVTDLAQHGTALDTVAHNVSKVDSLLQQWIGPVYAAGWTQQQKETWAGTLRNDPNGEQRLVDMLKAQRVAMFGEYKDPNLSYQDIAGPWRSVWSQSWGQQPDETDPLFNQIVKTNDLQSALQILRSTGLQRGVKTVVQSAVSALGSSDLGGSVRRMA